MFCVDTNSPMHHFCKLVERELAISGVTAPVVTYLAPLLVMIITFLVSLFLFLSKAELTGSGG